MRKIMITVLLAALLFCSAQARDIATIEQAQEQKRTAHQMAECARALELAEDDTVILTAQRLWWEADAAERELNEQDAGYSYTTPEQWAEHPVAAQCYEYLRSNMGLSPAVASGLLGGMCQECGGCTLDLQWWLSASGYRGLHMWSLRYCPEMATADLQGQLEYLAGTLDKNIDYFGGSSTYFRSITDPGTACAYAYTWYGRGYGSATRSRLNCAYMVYDYFGGA